MICSWQAMWLLIATAVIILIKFCFWPYFKIILHYYIVNSPRCTLGAVFEIDKIALMVSIPLCFLVLNEFTSLSTIQTLVPKILIIRPWLFWYFLASINSISRIVCSMHLSCKTTAILKAFTRFGLFLSLRGGLGLSVFD